MRRRLLHLNHAPSLLFTMPPTTKINLATDQTHPTPYAKNEATIYTLITSQASVLASHPLQTTSQTSSTKTDNHPLLSLLPAISSRLLQIKITLPHSPLSQPHHSLAHPLPRQPLSLRPTRRRLRLPMHLQICIATPTTSIYKPTPGPTRV